ncbi:MFS transporter [Streptomyces sp. NBC_01387]|uniref:MFS transporter n=1 Tax=unclassified Streptomyces TaxID=2593676 RepID=UPI002E334654|nr:MFS transporter [Streptomyces sp. NBC_01267]
MTDSAISPAAHMRGTPGFRRATGALFAAGMTTFMTLYCVQALLPALSSGFHLSPAASSLTISVSTAAMAVAVVPLTALSDAWSRTGMMSLALGAAALLGIAAAFAPNYPVLLVFRVLQGLALAGLQATAMSYLAEEVHRESLGQAMGLYVAGNGIGGMAGRLVADGVLDLTGSWRWAIGAVGVVAAVCAVVFHLSIPASVRFVRREARPRALASAIGRALPDTALLRLYLIGFVAMAGFVTVYNYLGFRLIAEPFDLSQTTAGLLFVAYVAGSFSSAAAGRLVDRYGRPRVLVPALLVALAGLAVMLVPSLGAVIPGLVIFTVGFFAAHAVASGWVGGRSTVLGVQGAAVYLFFYYIGSAVGGSVGGIAYSSGAWGGLTLYCACLLAIALISAVTLSRVRAASRPSPVTAPADADAGTTAATATGTDGTAGGAAPAVTPPGDAPGAVR